MKKTTRLILGIVLLAALIGAVLWLGLSGAQDKEPAPTAAPTPTPTAEPTPEPTPTPEPDNGLPKVDTASWELLLVNPWNNIGDYSPETAQLENVYLDARIIDAMEQFVAAARAEGLSVRLNSGYRTYYDQSYLYNRKVAEYGTEVAKTIVAPPGTSEHQSGLACDITDRSYEYLNSELENTELYKWMSAHCQEYGFIVRYPKDKQDITGIIYEPWHFRYVGVEAATYIMENGLCLEEFLELYNE